MARAQTMWKEWRQDLMWQPSVAPLRLQALHLIMRPRRTASSTFSSPPDSLTHTCISMHAITSTSHRSDGRRNAGEAKASLCLAGAASYAKVLYLADQMMDSTQATGGNRLGRPRTLTAAEAEHCKGSMLLSTSAS